MFVHLIYQRYPFISVYKSLDGLVDIPSFDLSQVVILLTKSSSLSKIHFVLKPTSSGCFGDFDVVIMFDVTLLKYSSWLVVVTVGLMVGVQAIVAVLGIIVKGTIYDVSMYFTNFFKRVLLV